MMYVYGRTYPNVDDWAFDTLNSNNEISYYLSAYFQSFMIIVGNYQARGILPFHPTHPARSDPTPLPIHFDRPGYIPPFLSIHPSIQVPLNNDERVFFIVVGILGVCFYSAVVGQMSVLVANMNTVGLRHT
jgi:hypothetical protein